MTLLEYVPTAQRSLYGYALLRPDRDPYYLPMTTKPQRVGNPRNVELDQPPFEEESFVVGDKVRRVQPLILVGDFDKDDLQEPTEDGVRLLIAEIDEAVRFAVGAQRGQSMERTLHPTGYVEFDPTTILKWTYTITLHPTGPSWINSTTGTASPF